MTKGMSSKPVIGLIGFFARGNSGDEAILQCIYEVFKDDYDFVIVIEETGAYKGYWDWYPYCFCTRINTANLAYFQNRLAGVIVGGGGLGLGFGANQIIVAKGAGTPVALVGTDYTSTSDKSKHIAQASALYLNLFDYIALRSRESTDCATANGISVNYGTDWALRLLSDNSVDVTYDPKRAIVVLREYPWHELNYHHYRNEIIRLVKNLQQKKWKPTLMPFCPEDQTFLQKLQLENVVPSEVHWWNPRRLKQIISESGILISVGRLHPIIFAATIGVPSIQVHPPIIDVRPNSGKLKAMASEFSVPYLANIESLCKLIQNETLPPPGITTAVIEAQKRLDTTIGDLRELFRF